MFICIFLTWALCLLLDWYQCTWLDDDGPAASLLPRFTVTSGAQPAFSVSLHYDHPGYHLPQQQVQLLHMVVPQKNLPGCLAQVRTSQYLSLDPCTVTYRDVDSLDCFQHMILVHVIVIIGKLYNINTDFFIVSFFFLVSWWRYLCRPQRPVFQFGPLQYGNSILFAGLRHLVGSKRKVIISMRGGKGENMWSNSSYSTSRADGVIRSSNESFKNKL